MIAYDRQLASRSVVCVGAAGAQAVLLFCEEIFRWLGLGARDLVPIPLMGVCASYVVASRWIQSSRAIIAMATAAAPDTQG